MIIVIKGKYNIDAQPLSNKCFNSYLLNIIEHNRRA